jgi:hypothetical protein
MQTSLNAIAKAKLTITGKLDGPTQRAIRAFKKRKKVRTREAYTGPVIERALVAAGAQAPPTLGKVLCGVQPASVLVPLLDKHRGDIPAPFLMGWMQVESGRDIGSLTSICERGLFQVHPSESVMLGLDHDRLSANVEYSVSGGIAMVKYYRRQVDALSRTYSVARGSDLYWRLVKLCHWIPSGPKVILAKMQKEGAAITDWNSVRTFVAAHKDAIEATIKRDPVAGLDSVDHTFTKVDAWARTLKTP